ncbi:MAG TPA: chemotaxis protein CheA [Polyangiaceae bacterium]|nr:chemotaxis protein CheA [Polyangiaceae bacterium]
MTGPADLQEFVAAYLVEAEEHLTVANAQLLAIESSQRSGETNPRAVRETFRSLHTIKGLSAMVGVEPVVAIAHRMENFLRDSDRSGGALPLSAIDALLRGVRAIEQRITALGRGDSAAAPSEELLVALDSLGLGAAPVARSAETVLDLEPGILEKLAPFEVDQLLRGVAAGQRALRAEFSPSPERAAQGLTINSVRERMTKVADIVRVLPRSVPISPAAPGGLCFILILLSGASDEAIAEAVGLDSTSLHSIAHQAAEGRPEAELLATAEDGLDGAEDAPIDTHSRRGVVRVDVNRLDDAMEGLSALIVTRYRLARSIASLTERGVNTRELSEIMKDNARQLRDLRAAIVRVRMVPVSELLERIPLLVRGLRRATQRSVRLELEGGNAELDKSVSERLFPVIVHLVRNAVDHAIETPDERLRRGKPEEGLLRITCGARGSSRLEITVSDDGRGIDRDAVARKAGRTAPGDDAGLLDLLCSPGLSTREIVTTTSGRGMGMEIVKRTVVDELGGELSVHSQFGQGTTFTLRVPLTISIVDAFSFECGEQRFVVPVAMVDEIIEVDANALVQVPANDDGSPAVDIISRRGMALPLIQLAQVFRLKATPSGAGKAIVVRRAGAPVAFAVDRMLGQQEVVIRPINDALVRAPGVSGATDLGDGRPTLVLDLVALSASLAHFTTAEDPKSTAQLAARTR